MLQVVIDFHKLQRFLVCALDELLQKIIEFNFDFFRLSGEAWGVKVELR